jgi:hypothetical protein
MMLWLVARQMEVNIGTTGFQNCAPPFADPDIPILKQAKAEYAKLK